MIFAEAVTTVTVAQESAATVNDLIAAAVSVGIAVIFGLGTIAAALVRKIVKRIESTDTSRETKEVVRKVDSMLHAVNGGGIMGGLKAVLRKQELNDQKQDAHNADDAKRFGEINDKMDDLGGRMTTLEDAVMGKREDQANG